MEIKACKPWVEAEIAVVRPRVLVALAATAAQALFGRDFRVTVSRGKLVKTPLAPFGLATMHPSSLLRAQDDKREAAIARFVENLVEVKKGDEAEALKVTHRLS